VTVPLSVNRYKARSCFISVCTNCYMARWWWMQTSSFTNYWL